MEFRLLRYFLAVAEERHVGRAATRLRMTQPPLSRAIRQLEAELGVVLLTREPHGVELTAEGAALYREARSIVEQAERLTARVTSTARTPTITVGTCADTAAQLGSRLVTEFRHLHPDVGLTLYETDLTDPTAGLRTDVVDVALIRLPVDETGLACHVLRSDPVGVVLRADDPLAGRGSVTVADVRDRRWVRLPEGTDPIWSAYWRVDESASAGQSVVVRTIQESLQSVLWSDTATFAPLNQPLPDGLVNVPVLDKRPSLLAVACRLEHDDPIVAAFVGIATGSRRAADR